MTDSKTALYRWYDSDKTLLYIGISSNVARRASEHGKSKPWWELVASSDVIFFDTRDDALDAEREMIRELSPVFNIQHNMRRHEYVQPEDRELPRIEEEERQREIERIFRLMTHARKRAMKGHKKSESICASYGRQIAKLQQFEIPGTPKA